MTQIAKLTATVLAGAADQAVAHGLDRIPDLIFIVEENEAVIKDALKTRCLSDVAAVIGTTTTKVDGAATVDVTIANIFYIGTAIGVDFWTLGPGPPIFECTQNMYNKCLLCVDDQGAMQISPGTEAATDAGVILGATPADSVVVAVLSVHPTTADFVGGTTVLNGTVNATFEDVAFHPDVFGEITLGKAADATNVYVDNNMALARAVEIIAFALHSIIA